MSNNQQNIPIPLLDGITGIIKDLNLGELFKGKETKRREFELKLAMLQQSILHKQLEVNKAEASHKSIFVAGWRPFCGWVCGGALAYHFVFRDLIIYIFQLLGSQTLPPPKIDISELISILLALLGMYASRAVEKHKNLKILKN